MRHGARFAVGTSIGAYFFAGLYFLSLPIELKTYSSIASKLFCYTGFQVPPHISKAIIVSVALSCTFNLAFLVYKVVNKRSSFMDAQRQRNALASSVKSILTLVAAIFFLGVIGENISAKSISQSGKERSILIACSVYGGIVWILADFFLSATQLIKRRF